MPFTPINNDHAIQGATFTVGLTQPIQKATMERLWIEPASWRGELPAIEQTGVFELQPNPQTGVPRPVVTPGAEFSFKRPDGTSAWLMRFAGSEVSVETTLYTRWAPTWIKASTFLSAAIERIVALEPGVDYAVRASLLTVVDVFRSSDEEPKFDEVLQRSDRLPDRIFGVGSLWHCHTGWFAQMEGGRVLNHLNVDTKKTNITDAVSGAQASAIDVQINHSQTMQYTPQLPAAAVEFPTTMHKVNHSMQQMHLVNKAEMARLLNRAMCDQIGLVS